MIIELTKGKYLEVQSYIGTANGKKFPGVRILTGGKRRREIVASFPARRVLEVVSALQTAFDQSHTKVPANSFYNTREWEQVRYDVLVRDGFRCVLCGSSGESVQLHVDHVKPRSKFPHLELEPSNLRTTCRSCNLGKGAKLEVVA